MSGSQVVAEAEAIVYAEWLRLCMAIEADEHPGDELPILDADDSWEDGDES